MHVYILVEEWGEYNDYSKTIIGVFSSAEKAMASEPDVPWQDDRTGATYSLGHATHAPTWCFQCRTDWSVEEWVVDDERA